MSVVGEIVSRIASRPTRVARQLSNFEASDNRSPTTDNAPKAQLHHRSSVASAAIFESEAGVAFLGLFHAVFADLRRDDGDVSEVEVDVIVGVGASDVAVREDVNVVAQIFRDGVVLLDRLLPFQDGRTDAVDVGGSERPTNAAARRSFVELSLVLFEFTIKESCRVSKICPVAIIRHVCGLGSHRGGDICE